MEIGSKVVMLGAWLNCSPPGETGSTTPIWELLKEQGNNTDFLKGDKDVTV